MIPGESKAFLVAVLFFVAGTVLVIYWLVWRFSKKE